MFDVKLDNLAAKLFKRINNDNTDIFKTKLVIVPSLKIEAYLKAYFLKNMQDVLLNVSFLSINKALQELFDTDYKIANRGIIRSLIIKYLIDNASKINELKDYININNKETYQINLFDVSDKIREAFEAYDEELYEPTGYQHDIYDYINNELINNGFATARIINNLNNYKKIEAYVFGFSKYTNLEKSIIDKFKIIEIFELKYNNEKIDLNKIQRVVKAPSRTREIEALHSDICKRLVDNHDLSLSDFLVVSPNICEYEVEINRVFSQEYKNYPSIPFFIDAPKMYVNATNDLLNKLLNIGNKGFFTRKDIIDIFDNWIVKNNKNITDNDLDNFKKIILNLKVYRKKTDWDYLKKRLLISKISDTNEDNNSIELSDGTYLPFTLIGLSDKNISDLIEVINNLNEIIELFKNEEVDISDLKIILEKWLSIKEYNIEKNNYYNKMIELLDFIKNNNFNMPIYTLFYSLLDLTGQTTKNEGFLYTSGITFENFNSNVILAAKYIYFIGASSNNFPAKKDKNPFDLLNTKIDYKEEETAFKLYCLNASNLYFSYVNKDLKENQEQYFLSSFVKKIYDNKADIKYYDMPLDEKRSYEEIFTKRAFDNKKLREELVSKPEFNSILNNNPNNNQLVEVTVGNMANYLSEPLSFKAGILFGKDDETDDKLEEEFEPFGINNLDSSIIFKEMAINSLIGIPNDDLYKQLKLENKLPNISEDIARKEFNEIEKNVEAFIKNITENNYEYEIIRKNPYPKDDRIITISDTLFDDWKLINDSDMIRIKTENDEYIYMPIKSLSKVNAKDLLSAYILAMKDICDYNEERKFIIKADIKTYVATINPSKARKILKSIYDSMNDYSDENNKFFDFSLLTETEYEKNKDNLKDLLEGFRGNNAKYWKYFNSKNLFDYYKQLGYGDDYQKELEAMQAKMKDLIKLEEA